jgi:hypothetical protein
MITHTPAMVRKHAVRGEETLVVHVFRGSQHKVTGLYHRDVDMMGWLGYVEVEHILTDRPRRWTALFKPPQKQLEVTYRRLD